jgi:hypothetical protein
LGGLEVLVGWVVSVGSGGSGVLVGAGVAVGFGVRVWVGLRVFVGRVVAVGTGVGVFVGVGLGSSACLRVAVGGMFVFVGRVTVKEGGMVGVLAPATGIRSSSVGEAAMEGSATGKFVGVKKSMANAPCVNALSIGVTVAVYLGSRTMSSRLSGDPPLSKKGKLNARIAVPKTARRIT